MKFSPQNERQFAVVGLGRFGRNIAKSLHEMGYDVLAIDKDMEKVQDFSHEVTHVVQADTTDEEALRSLGILNFDVVIVAIGDDTEANIMTTLQLKEIGVPYIVAIAKSPLQIKVLEKSELTALLLQSEIWLVALLITLLLQISWIILNYHQNSVSWKALCQKLSAIKHSANQISVLNMA